MTNKRIKYYSKPEETANVITHGIGFLLSIPALIFLIFTAIEKGEKNLFIGYLIFGFSMILLYLTSTLYHYTKEKKLRRKLNILDHAAIYILIAGTYTPFILVGLEEGWKETMFTLIWGIAILGIFFKLFFTGRFNILSTVLYVFMGWLVLVAYKPLSEGISYDSLFWLFAGGVSYTIGAVLYSIKVIPFNHAIFHLFVLLGTLCHFISVIHLTDKVF